MVRDSTRWFRKSVGARRIGAADAEANACLRFWEGIMKFQFASLAKKLRHRAFIFAAVMVVVPTLLMSASFSQDGPRAVKVPKHIASDATAASRIMGEQRTYG